MSDTKFTSGPWILVPDEWDEDRLRVTTESRESPSDRKVEIAQVDTGYSDPFGEQQRANAHLIAAAPDLAEVARKLVEDYDAWASDSISQYEIGDIVNEARVALKKARGES